MSALRIPRTLSILAAFNWKLWGESPPPKDEDFMIVVGTIDENGILCLQDVSWDEAQKNFTSGGKLFIACYSTLYVSREPSRTTRRGAA